MPTEGEDSAESAAVAVVEKVAEVEGADPLEMMPPLSDILDPDALDALFATGDRHIMTTINYRGHAVTIYGSGEVDVLPAAEPADPPVRTLAVD